MRRLIIFTLAIFSVASLWAQQGDLKKQVEVTKDYMPDVERAAKLDAVPNMIDTVTLRPEISYAIRPTPWLGAFGVQAISPVKVNAATYNPVKPFYIKVGGGYPLNSLLDFYAANNRGGDATIGGYVNHSGQYANILNDAGRDAKALQTNNAVGVFAGTNFGRLSLEGELGYDYDIYSRYGEFRLEDHLLEDYGHSSVMQSYSTPRARLSFGNAFTDLSYFNFRLGADVYYMSDRFDYAETGVKAFMELGKMFSIHKIYLKADVASYSGSKSLKEYGNTLFRVSPRYEIVTDRFKLGIGGDFVIDNMKGGNSDAWFFPDFKMTFDVTSGYLVPFIDINGGVVNNGYRSTALQNPYIASGLTMANTAEYNGRAGISGSVSSAFSYRAYAGVSIYKKMNFLANMYTDGNSAEFILPRELTDNVTMFTVGAEADGRISGSFTLSAAAHYYGYTLKKLDKAAGRPNFDASLGVRYNYRDKFSIALNGQFLSSRHFYEAITMDGAEPTLLTSKVDPVVNLNLDVDFKVSNMVGIFLQGRNLVNSKLYQFNHYPSVGVSCSAGVKLLF